MRRVEYRARGGDRADTGKQVVWIVLQVCVGWDGRDTAVWLVEEGQPPRLIAVVRPRADGEPVVTWS